MPASEYTLRPAMRTWVALPALLVAAFVTILAAVPARAQIGSQGGGPENSGIESSLGPSDIEQLKSGGGLSPDKTQQLCASIAAKHISPAELKSLGASLGLNGDQMTKLQSCSESAAPMPAGGVAGQTAPSPLTVEPGTPNPVAETGVSSIETRFRQLESPSSFAVEPSAAGLSQFGYELFSSKVSTFAPAGNPPVSADYILGPDDTLNLLLWGRINQTLSLQVQRDGTILMPQIGPLEVAGLSFDQAKKLIERRGDDITGLQVDVTMGQVRAIQVFVIGKVSQSGLYTVSSLSHISNALVAAGGIGKIGSLRDIQLRRDNRLIGTLDLYDMLLRGDTSADVGLRPRDVIFVPVIGPVVGITGDVKSPAIYELKRSEGLGNVLKMAGGVTAFGYSERVQVERVENHQRRIALDLNLADPGVSQYPVNDGDLVRVFTVLPRQRNVVKVLGNVNRPGKYQWHPDMRVSDLVREAQEVADRTFFEYALVRRLEGPERRVHMIPVNLDAALSNESDSSNLRLEPEDELTIYKLDDIADLPNVEIQGEVRKPGTYPLTPGMRVRDLIYEAGGLRDDAARDRAQLSRIEVENSVAHYMRSDIDLQSAIDGAQDNVALRSRDQLLVQQASNWHASWHVSMAGEVMRPGPYAIQEGEHLSEVLRECGGFRSDAYPPAAVFIRKGVKKIQQEQLDRARSRLQEEVARLSVMPRQAGQAENTPDALILLKNVLSETESQQAVGRVVLNLTSVDALERSTDNVVMQDGDTLVIPEQPSSVQVLGQVYNPTAIVYKPGMTVADYLQSAGGPTEGADADHLYVIRANGAILTEEGVRLENHKRMFPLLSVMSAGLMETRLQSGDTIYVPEQLIYVSSLQYAKDITQIIANSMQSLAIVGILASNL